MWCAALSAQGGEYCSLGQSFFDDRMNRRSSRIDWRDQFAAIAHHSQHLVSREYFHAASGKTPNDIARPPARANAMESVC
jgi:hypothetical protein